MFVECFRPTPIASALAHWTTVLKSTILLLACTIRYEYYTVPAERHSTMTNMTSRLAINIRYLPDFDFSWSDCTPQCPRSALQTDVFLPTEIDAAIIKERSVQYVMRFLVETFPNLKNLETLIPPKEPLHPVARSEAIPMKILFKDEKFKSVTIEILSQLLTDADLSGTDQVGIQEGTDITMYRLFIILV